VSDGLALQRPRPLAGGRRAFDHSRTEPSGQARQGCHACGEKRALPVTASSRRTRRESSSLTDTLFHSFKRQLNFNRFSGRLHRMLPVAPS